MRALLAWSIGAVVGCTLFLNVHPADAQSSKAAPKLTAPTAPPTATTAPPSSAIGTPMSSPSPIAPLSPQTTTTPLTGGTVRADKLPSPTSSSASPSESAQSTAGGGALGDCVRFWDSGTHMTKGEW